MTSKQHLPFYVDRSVNERLRNRLSEVRTWKPDGFFYYRTHPFAHNLEVMLGPDLAAGMEAVPHGVQPEQRARRFLLEMAEYLGIDDANLFERQLSLKHTMTSLMGSHCIFELRDRTGKEILPSFFAVHIDTEQRIVMLHCAYQNSIEPIAQLSTSGAATQESVVVPAPASPAASSFAAIKPAMPVQMWEDRLRKEFGEEFPKDTIRHITFNYDIWLPDWEAERYIQGCQAKVQTTTGDYVFLIPLNQDLQTTFFPAESRLNPNGLALGRVYRDFWADGQALEEKVETNLVILRDMTSGRGGLHGKYVAVLDNLTDFTLDPVDRKHWLKGPDTVRSEFDQVMVYHHIDFIQRYFRQLGLSILDDYQNLNPLHVVLTGRNGSDVGAAYRYELKSIVLRQLLDGTGREWTMARDARILYHEYVHAVTDSLARLQRVAKDGSDCSNVRLLEMLQSVALDEGMADYFACSLAARQGGASGEYGTIVVDEEGASVWKVGERRLIPTDADLKPIIHASIEDVRELCNTAKVEAQYYLWGTVWASYLWKLRTTLGSDVADTIIAHSILFLSRWSGFMTGICALIQADLLLFAGENQKVILELSGLGDELSVQLDEQPESEQALSVTNDFVVTEDKVRAE